MSDRSSLRPVDERGTDSPRGAGTSQTPRWPRDATPVAIFVALAAVLYLVVWFSANHLDLNAGYSAPFTTRFRGSGLLGGWIRYDGGWYRIIADDGYSYTPGRQSSVAFWPAYPLTMRTVAWVTGDTLLAGIAITFVSGLGVAMLFHRWCLRILSPKATVTALVLLLVFPYAWYLYGAVYADAFFLMLVLSAFMLLENDRPVLAGIVAGMATAARPVGIGVVIGLVAVMVDRRGMVVIPYFDRVRAVGWRAARTHTGADQDRAKLIVAPRRLRWRDAGVLLSVSGFVAWVSYLWIVWGSPTIFADIEGVPGWDQGQGPATWFKIHWLRELQALPRHLGEHAAGWNAVVYGIDITAQGLLVIGCFALVPLVIRRIGWSYAVYVLAIVAIPAIGTKDWQGSGRYLLVAFPVFAAVGDWLSGDSRRMVRVGVIGASAAALGLLTSMYARGYYLA